MKATVNQMRGIALEPAHLLKINAQILVLSEYRSGDAGVQADDEFVSFRVLAKASDVICRTVSWPCCIDGDRADALDRLL
ncbi:hypothetical protein A9976_00475 [Delftia sp. UME58]|nr:hypothetical protein [Delftia sp. UME58]